MVTRLDEIRQSALSAIAGVVDAAQLEAVRIEFTGQKSALMQIPGGFGGLPAEQRAAAGRGFNEVKGAIQAALEQRRQELDLALRSELVQREAVDVTFPGPPPKTGYLHLLTRTRREIETILEGIGYQVHSGPEVETDWYNFEALNLPRGHASRDVQDTFFVDESEQLLLRTHTSPMQIRAMEALKTPPLYVIVPGRTYRRDATDATHLAQFMQVEALAVDVGLSVADLKGTILYFAQSMWGPERSIRIRPNDFPYTEPSFEFDISCGVCGGAGCRSCGGDGWLEVGGCGMVHPQVLANGGIDPDAFSGFAWGLGIERIAMLKYDIDDLRLLYDNDLRFLEQFP
ncbi:MAG TPA: phenylalanine--tRNA ligase subunit alpha [Candidatus Acidoferrales bacterium]|nr:phenylalanine--tRNA ligase subunit alpha [Candidatus Acidoferrales bacterium]